MRFFHGDCLEKMRELGDGTIDSIVTDPPYGLSFMGKGWDYGVPGSEFWVEALRVAKPGTHLLAFGGTRTYHRLAVAIEDAGWEIRDCVMWVYGSGFPKSHDVSKAIDKAAGAEREVVGHGTNGMGRMNQNNAKAGYRPNPYSDGVDGVPVTAPATDAARQWSGWGTALKPAWEPIVVARKPLSGTVAANVLAHGTGALNIDACRVGTESTIRPMGGKETSRTAYGAFAHDAAERMIGGSESGRWPANLVHDGSDEVVGLFPHTVSGGGDKRGGCEFFMGGDKRTGPTGHKVNKGSAARFFYCAKASKADRDEGCEGLDERKSGMSNGAQLNGEGYDKGQDIGLNRVISRRNHHPTVKPTALMRYLCRLVTPQGGIVLDPFMGSGSTGKAAVVEGFDFIGIEKESEYLHIAEARIKKAKEEKQEQLL